MSMYSSRFVMSVLLNGKPQSERKDGVVQLPMYPEGTEYSLRFRNKHNRRAVVQFSIDGEDVSGPGYIVPANGSIDILRHFHKDVKFKFVSLDSAEAVDFGKNDGNEDGSKGVIEARFFLEKERPPAPVHIHHHHDHYYPKPYPVYPRPWPYNPYPVWSTHGGSRSMGMARSRKMTDGPEYTASCNAGPASAGGGPEMLSMADCGSANEAYPPLCNPAPTSRKKELLEGCTVEGAASGQRFTTVDIELETDYVPLRIVLRGYKADSPPVQVVSEEVTHCTQCGTKRSRKSDKFCGSCGHKF